MSGAALPPLSSACLSPRRLGAGAAGGVWLVAWALVVGGYLGLVLLNAALGGLRFRSLRVEALAAVGSVAVHLTYALSLLRGLFAR